MVKALFARLRICILNLTIFVLFVFKGKRIPMNKLSHQGSHKNMKPIHESHAQQISRILKTDRYLSKPTIAVHSVDSQLLSQIFHSYFTDGESSVKSR
jgi:hypothetical protein